MTLSYFKRSVGGTPLPMRTTEVEPVRFDFTDDLASGETVSSVGTSVVRVYRGVDGDPSSILSGSATASGAIVSQKLNLATAVDGVTYVVDIVAVTSEAHTKVRSGLVWVSDDPDAKPPV